MSRSSMIDLARVAPARAKRESSWERNGGNDDAVRIGPGETYVLADVDGPGIITHIYFTMIDPNPLDYRDGILRMYWDGEETPSVEVPFGDFFCVSNCTVRRFSSQMIAINPGVGPANHGFNCYFPMPFAKHARIELVNQGPNFFGGLMGRLWYHVDYEQCDEALPEDLGRFHAQWRRENPTTAQVSPPRDERRFIWPTLNTDGKDNYVILEAEGEGHVAGIFLQVNNIQGGWYGEGDDMIFIDGDVWPPSLHGTGSEEVFGGGACPNVEYTAPYTGFLQVENKGGDMFKGLNAMYRWYTNDPLRFRKSIRHTIEHGHCNDYENDYTSVAYWYQKEPHAIFPVLPAPRDRRPHFEEVYFQAMDEFAALCYPRVEIHDRYYKEAEPLPEWFDAFSILHTEGYCKAIHNNELAHSLNFFRAARWVAESNGYMFSK